MSETPKPIEELQPGEALDLCERLVAVIRLANANASMRARAWEKLARELAKRIDALKPSGPCIYEARSPDGTREGRAHGGAEQVWCRVHGFDCPNTLGVKP